MSNKTCVVVGGGVVGLLASYLASKNFNKVVLIERSDNLGGLLGSFEHSGAIYDYGTHVPAFTAVDPLDDILYGPKDERSQHYEFLPYLRSENYFLGHWNDSSPLLDTRNLMPHDYAQGIVELLEAPGADESETNLYQYLVLTFGKKFTEQIYRPVLKKLLNTELEDINKNVLRTFGLQRLIALTSEVTKQLKTVAKYDNSLGYHSYTDGSPPVPYCYPKGNNGIGYWPNQLIEKVESAGVEIVTGSYVNEIKQYGNAITALTLDNQVEVLCDHVLWSVPPALALKAANIKLESSPPKFRTHTLCHFEFEEPLLKTFPQYLLCWESTMLSYRITLYPNITKDRKASGKHNLTVEVLSDVTAEHKTQEIQSQVLDEMRMMKVIAENNKVINSQVSYMGNSFPILTDEFLDNTKQLQNKVYDTFSNMTLLGRGAGATFFINDLLIETYQKVKDLSVANG